jgi:hypothetical protein
VAKTLGDSARIERIDLVLTEMQMGIHGCRPIDVNGIHIINTANIFDVYNLFFICDL